ncbi:uncharacterized protein LOC5512641 isoform X1 [Nematostella vectensis]|uniref:uncharacterized protein LOC5512641 isoform X1 n=2 Tax=Nematostella vectensis TaxID=45351 RepID=UPI0020771F43|nr:uncharacterized protein LOC5512641 isoform X1 [Nematostella vectensis]
MAESQEPGSPTTLEAYGEGNEMSNVALLEKEDKKSGSVSMLPAVAIKGSSKKPFISCQMILLAVAVVLFVIGFILLIVGIVFITKTPECQKAQKEDTCAPSDEAKRSGLYDLLEKLHSSYYEMYPNKIAYKRPVTVEEIRRKYRAHDPSPATKRRTTDRIKALLKEVDEFKVDNTKLKPREAKALAQARFTVKYMFGKPYDMNYYAGDYMLGPNLWCMMQPICTVGGDISANLRYFRPNSTADLETLRNKLMEINSTFTQYITNLRYGVNAGMVRTVEQCKRGINGLTESYPSIAFKGALGVYTENFMGELLDSKFLSSLMNNTDEANKWRAKYGKTASESLREFALEYVGEPIDNLFRYLKDEHAKYCVPDTVSSGLASLPLPYVYVNGTADKSRPTTKKLPTGEALDGKKAYEMSVGYFTTNDFTPDQIYELGYKMLNKLYPQVLAIAREVSGKTNDTEAKKLFQARLKAPDMSYNQQPFPANESDEDAHRLCRSDGAAMIFCPTRWREIQKWFVKALEAISLLDPRTVNMFYFTGPKITTPNCPIKVGADYNPSASANYESSGASCLQSCRYNIPFFSENYGPVYEEMSTCAHEARPGHHTQVQGLEEHFRDKCGGVISWVDNINYYVAFTEGWGLYAENPLVGEDTNVYDGIPLEKYGMLKWQIWRALRLIVDSGLHYKNLTRADALKLFADFAWDTSALAELEVTRYQSAFGQATSYMIGQQQIVQLRQYAEKELGKDFSLKEFHYQLLSQGSSPLSHLKNSIERYVSCAKDKTISGCSDVLDPPKRRTRPTEDKGVLGDYIYRNNPLRLPMLKHYV